jgi:hypothetical protein
VEEEGKTDRSMSSNDMMKWRFVYSREFCFERGLEGFGGKVGRRGERPFIGHCLHPVDTLYGLVRKVPQANLYLILKSTFSDA